MESDY